MANRYQDETFPADSDRAGQGASARESDPLAELARLIGQTDPFSNSGRANPQPVARPAEPAWLPEAGADDHDAPAAAPLPWMQHRATHPVAAEPGEREFVHPVRRYAASQRAADHLAPPAVNPDSDDQRGYDQQAYDRGPHGPDHAERYDDALYAQMPGDPAHSDGDGVYPDDSYAYQDGYEEEIADGRLPSSRRGGLMTVVAVLALAVIGTGGAFAYRTYVGSPRSGEPPVIKADTAPTKVVPAPSTDAAAKPIQDRLATGNAEQLVSREEQPVDVKDNTKAGPRVVFPPLATNGSPPSAASVAIVAPPPPQAAPVAPAGDEPRKIKTYTVRPDQPDGAAAPAARTARASVPARNAPAVAAPAGNAPLSLSPQAGNAGVATRVASNNPTQPVATSGAGGYVVQISSQRNEADAKASFRAMQGKFPSVLGSRFPLIKRADLGPKGVYYRAMVGPFGSPEDATQFCGSLKTAGGQCVVQRN